MSSLFQRPTLPEWATSKEAYWSEYFRCLWWALVILFAAGGFQWLTSACQTAKPRVQHHNAKPAGLGMNAHEVRNEKGGR